MQITKKEIVDIFRRLGFSTEESGQLLNVTVPTRRLDIAIEEDFIEEVARLYGYDNIPSTLPETRSLSATGLTPYQVKRRKTRRFLEGAGLSQAITYSLTNERKVEAFALTKSFHTKLSMPMSEERSILRHSLIPHLADAAAYNLARQAETVALYEIGSVFVAEKEGAKPTEKEHVAGLVTGLWHKHLWQGEKKAADFYVIKGITEGLFGNLGVLDDIEYVRAVKEDLHPGRTAEIYFRKNAIGFVGQLHPNYEKEFDLNETYVFELDLHALLTAETEELIYTAIPRHPSVSRDIALVVDQKVSSGELEKVIREAGGSLLKEVQVFDVYEGEHVEAGKKSIAFSLTYLNPEQTLTEEEVTSIHQNVLNALEETYQAKLRQ
jgi:phenylalanyl-tRNA synthetase beta chain